MLLSSFAGLEPKLKQVIVDVPELGEDAKIIVREMNGRRMANYQRAMSDYPDFPVEHLIVACCVDEKGNQIAKHNEVVTISELLPMTVSNRLIEACREVNETLFESAEAKKND